MPPCALGEAAYRELLAAEYAVAQAAPSLDGPSWYATHVEVAASGDVGFTFGPWTTAAAAAGTDAATTPAASATTPAAAATGAATQGQFLSIWVRDSACRWQVQFDAGISYAAAPAQAQLSAAQAAQGQGAQGQGAQGQGAQGQGAQGQGAQGQGAQGQGAHAAYQAPSAPPASLITENAVGQAIGGFQRASLEDGIAAGLRTYARNSGFLLLWEGEMPMELPAANGYFTRHTMLGQWQQEASGSSADATLVYSTGVFVEAKHQRRYAGAQIWQYDPKVANWGLRILFIAP
jgi:hypothetical protein